MFPSSCVCCAKKGACFIKLIRLIKNSSNYQHEKYACLDSEDFFNCCFACKVLWHCLSTYVPLIKWF